MTVKTVLEMMIPTQLIKINEPGNTGNDPLESGTVAYLLANSIYLKDEVEEEGMYRCAIDTSYIAIHLRDKPRFINLNIHDNVTISDFKNIMDNVHSQLMDMGITDEYEMSCILTASVSKNDGHTVIPVIVTIAKD